MEMLTLHSLLAVEIILLESAGDYLMSHQQGGISPGD